MHERESQPYISALVAALLAIAIVATLLFVARVHRAMPAPVKAGTAAAPTSATCVGYTPPSQNLVLPEKMLSATTGWAQGALRTTDGGVHWHDVAPPSLTNRADGYAEFFLDSTHAWTAQAVSSATSCVDHTVTFMTTDGGQTWHPSEPVALDIQADFQVGLQLDFVDAQHGWLLVQSGPVSIAPYVPVEDAYLYVTSDGGLHWTLISHRSRLIAGTSACYSPLGIVVFASQTTGWSQIPCQPDNTLLVTHDRGATWQVQRLPQPRDSNCPCYAGLPVLFDARQGIIQVTGDAWTVLLGTSDGGRTWLVRSPLPRTGYSLNIDFLDAHNGWDLVSQPGWTKGSVTRDWLYRTGDGGQTWTLVQTDIPLGLVAAFLFVDADTGFAWQFNGPSPSATNEQVLVTTDGGHNWRIADIYVEGK